MWAKFTLWLSKHSITSKTVASAWLFAVALYYASQPFHDYVTWVYSEIPKPIHGFIAGVVVPACLFWKTWKGRQDV